MSRCQERPSIRELVKRSHRSSPKEMAKLQDRPSPSAEGDPKSEDLKRRLILRNTAVRLPSEHRELIGNPTQSQASSSSGVPFSASYSLSASSQSKPWYSA